MSQHKAAREDGPEALCLDDSPLAEAMRQAWAEVGTGPFPIWNEAGGQVWPHADWQVRQRFQARVNEILYVRCGIDPVMTTEEVAAVARQVKYGKRLATDDREEMMRLILEEHWPIPHAAAHFKVDRESVRRLLKRRGIAPKKLFWQQKAARRRAA